MWPLLMSQTHSHPSISELSLWNKLAAAGLTGQYFDRLCTLYDKMSYVLVREGSLSDQSRHSYPM